MIKEDLFIKINSAGQSLLEMTVAIGVAALVITALTVTTLIGLRNSNYAQNQIQAAKLAQEGLEKLRSYRDRDNPICNGGTVYDWKTPAFWSSSFPSSSSTKFYLTQDPGNPSCFITDSYSAAKLSGELSLQGVFSRNIVIANDVDGLSKQFTINVSWNDYSGVHFSRLITILSNY